MSTKQEDTTHIRGWLAVLIIGLGLLTPAAAYNNLNETYRNQEPYFAKFPTLQMATNIYTCMLWIAIFVSVYAALVLYYRRPRAVQTAKMCLVIFVGLAIAANFTIPLASTIPPAARDEYLKHAVKASIQPLLWLAVWGTYLLRSKRVKSTYPDYAA